MFPTQTPWPLTFYLYEDTHRYAPAAMARTRTTVLKALWEMQ